MAELLHKRWEPQFEGLTRRDRHGCNYDAYLPDPLSGWNLTLPSDLAADIADAETAIRDLNQAGTSHVSLEGLARFLLRAESVASSKIEGLDAGPRRLIEAEAVIAEGGETADRIAVEVLGNIASMESAIELATREQQISREDLMDIHRILMDRSPTPQLLFARNRTGSGAAPTTPAALPSSHHHPSTSRTFSTTSSPTPTTTTTRPSSRPQSPTPNSRPSTPTQTVTAAPDGH